MTIKVAVEKWRFLFYFFFLSMVVIATQITKIFAAPLLAVGAPEGTPVERLGCGAFNRGNSEFGLGYGDGFTLDESHLEEAFGYGNTCTAWDYTPSREIIAMYFPALEYSIVIYLLFNFVTDMLTYERGMLPEWYFSMSKVLFPIAIFLSIQFRMIFVLIAYENVQTHTAAFLGFQFALVIIAIMNTMYIVLTGMSYPDICLNRTLTSIIAKIYLVCNLIISTVKIYATAYAVATGTVPDLLKTDVKPGLKWSKLIDNIWMLFNVLLPLAIACVRMRFEEPLIVEITMPKHGYEGPAGETTSLVR
jgi:hypothetical protein